MDAATFARALQISDGRAERWLPHLEAAMDRFGILTPRQQAAFLAQTGHESMWFKRTEENLIYSTPELIRKTWPFRFRSLDAARPFVRQPEKLANFVYANRIGNGDQFSGDGWRYRGRGLIMLTGKQNFIEAEQGLRLPLVNNPDLLAEDENAALSAAWWWHTRNLNQLADLDDIDGISGYINRGDPTLVALHQEERREAYVHALLVLEGDA